MTPTPFIVTQKSKKETFGDFESLVVTSWTPVAGVSFPPLIKSDWSDFSGGIPKMQVLIHIAEIRNDPTGIKCVGVLFRQLALLWTFPTFRVHVSVVLYKWLTKCCNDYWHEILVKFSYDLFVKQTKCSILRWQPIIFKFSQSVKTQPAVLALQRVNLDASFCGSRPLDQPHCILSFKQLSNPKLIKNTAHL